MSFLTIFTSPKPFIDPHVVTIQRNAIRSWTELGDQGEVKMIGDEEGMAEICKEFNIRHIPEVKTNEKGTPYINSIFDQARSNSDSPYLAYVNADIILLPNFLTSTKNVARQYEKFLLVGQRWDMDITQELDFNLGWQDRLEADRLENSKIYPPNGSDYFIYSRSILKNIPQFTVGRAGWDNWMIYHGAKAKWPAIDATNDIHVIHQNHDYHHLPEGKPHYRNPETFVNVDLAGGRRNMFLLIDTNKILVDGKVRSPGSFISRSLRFFERMFTTNDPDNDKYIEAIRKRINVFRINIENKKARI